MVQRIRISSHGEMVKHNSRDILFAKWKNGETVILTFIGPLFRAPLRQWGPSPLLDSISCCVQYLVYGRCRVDFLIMPRAAPTTFDAIPPTDFDQYIFSLPSFRHYQHRGGSSPFVTSSFSPLLAVHILSIYYIISVLL